jgi:hypothetical protein
MERGQATLREQKTQDNPLSFSDQGSLVEAELRGLRTELESEFPQLSEDRLLTDALLFCDMTTTPNGTRTTSWARVDEITSRYSADSLVGRFIRLAAPGIHATVERVQARAAAGGIPL